LGNQVEEGIVSSVKFCRKFEIIIDTVFYDTNIPCDFNILWFIGVGAMRVILEVDSWGWEWIKL
jgi:hypothetical protein